MGSIDIVTLLSFPIHELEMSFNVFVLLFFSNAVVFSVQIFCLLDGNLFLGVLFFLMLLCMELFLKFSLEI